MKPHIPRSLSVAVMKLPQNCTFRAVTTLYLMTRNKLYTTSLSKRKRHCETDTPEREAWGGGGGA